MCLSAKSLYQAEAETERNLVDLRWINETLARLSEFSFPEVDVTGKGCVSRAKVAEDSHGQRSLIG